MSISNRRLITDTGCGNISGYFLDPGHANPKWDEIRERMRRPKSKNDQEEPPEPKGGDYFIVVGTIVGLIAGALIGSLFGILPLVLGGIAGGIAGAFFGDWLKTRYLRQKDAPR